MDLPRRGECGSRTGRGLAEASNQHVLNGSGLIFVAETGRSPTTRCCALRCHPIRAPSSGGCGGVRLVNGSTPNDQSSFTLLFVCRSRHAHDSHVRFAQPFQLRKPKATGRRGIWPEFQTYGKKAPFFMSVTYWTVIEYCPN